VTIHGGISIMERVEDPELLKAVLDIINKMISPEATAKIDVVLVKDMGAMGLTIIDNDKERHWGTCKSYSHILVNIKIIQC
jgi:nitrous oxide reductase accessory protein NosL